MVVSLNSRLESNKEEEEGYPHALNGPDAVERVEVAFRVEREIVAPPPRGRRVQHQIHPAKFSMDSDSNQNMKFTTRLLYHW